MYGFFGSSALGITHGRRSVSDEENTRNGGRCTDAAGRKYNRLGSVPTAGGDRRNGADDGAALQYSFGDSPAASHRRELLPRKNRRAVPGWQALSRRWHFGLLPGRWCHSLSQRG